MKVLKFGGSTLSGIERIQRVLQLIENRLASEKDIILIFSAFGGMTDRLTDISEQSAQNHQEYQKAFAEFEKHHLEVIQTLIPGKIQTGFAEYVPPRIIFRKTGLRCVRFELEVDCYSVFQLFNCIGDGRTDFIQHITRCLNLIYQ